MDRTAPMPSPAGGFDLGDPRAARLWQQVREQPHRFDLFFVLRYLQGRCSQFPRLGRASRPLVEPLRLGQDPSLAFAPATIAEVLPSQAGAPECMTVWSFGLYGPNGPLPTHLTEYVRERLRQHEDATLARFSDIFHHRLLLLLFRAWSDAQPTTSLDRPAEDPFGRYLGSLVGLGLPSQQQRDAVPDHAKRYLAAHWSRSTRNPEGLCQALRHYFGVPVRLQEFCLHHLNLTVEQQTRLGGIPRQSQLGVDAVLGARVLDAQSKFRLQLGPLTLAQYRRMLPHASGFPELVAWVRNYLGIEYAWDFELVLLREEIPPARLGGDVQLGWTTWLPHRGASSDARDFRLNPEVWLQLQGAL